MDDLLALILDRGLIGLVVALVAIIGYVSWRLYRDLLADRNFWRDTALQAIAAGDTIAETVVREDDDHEA